MGHRIRTVLASMFLLLAGGASVLQWPIVAQETLVLYDDFTATTLDPDRWLGLDSGVTQEQVRQIKSNVLILASRVYSDPAGFGRTGVSGVRFTNPTQVTAIAADLRVMDVESVSCAVLPAFTRASVTVSGSFFYGGGITPRDGRKNDVRAGITIRRDSNAVDPEGALQATATVSQCTNSDCSSAITLPGKFINFESVPLKKRVPIRVEWDAEGDRFVFQIGDSGLEFISYADSPTVSLPEQPAGLDEKAIQVRNTVPGCAGARSIAHLDVQVGNVFVNASP